MKRGAEALADELARLPSLDTETLKDRWRRLYGREPPAHVSRLLLLRALAYRLQELALGGLKPETRRALLRRPNEAAAKVARKLTPGTRLVREWQGVTHQVIVLDDGVLFRGKRHRSLSEVARLITGNRWSGPLFGLKSAKKAEADERR